MNIPSQLWEAFTNPRPGDPFSLSDAQQARFARLLAESGQYLPGTFASGLPRDPSEFSKSHYKMFEWSLVLYLYLPPFLHAIGAPEDVIKMMEHLQAGVRLASSINGCTEQQRVELARHFASFARLWEELYIRDYTALVDRASISIHYLLHREHLRILDMVLGDHLDSEREEQFRLTVKLTRAHRALTEDEGTQQDECIQALVDQEVLERAPQKIVIRGRLDLPSGHMLRGTRTEIAATIRSACRFMAMEGEAVMYAEAVHFVCLGGDDDYHGKEAELLTDSA
ncbi:unnamed protein product, partial [Tilletia laevis]